MKTTAHISNIEASCMRDSVVLSAFKGNGAFASFVAYGRCVLRT